MAEQFTAKFKVDISDLKKNISDATRTIKEANATFKSQTAGMDKWADNADGLGAKLEQLDKVLGSQKTILAAYRAELERQKAAYEENGKRAEELKKKLQEMADKGVDKASEEYKKYKTSLQNVLKEQQNNEKAADDLKITILNQEAAVKNTEREIRHYQGSLDNLDKSTEEVVEDTKEANEGFTVTKGILADLAATAIKKAVSGLKNLGKAAVDAYKEFDAGADNVIKATGATGEAAKGLQESYKNVSKNVTGSFDAIGSALGEVNTRFGYTGEKLETTTEDFVKFADITGTDAVSAVQSVSRVMEKAGIKSDKYGDLLDALASAAQQTGISVDDLADKLEKSGTTMQGLGFTTEETVALFALWEKTGVKTEDAFGGMRRAFAKWTKEGKNGKKEFQKVLDTIKNAPSKTAGTQKAIEVFGQKAGPELAKAVQEGKLEYKDFLKTLQNSKGTVKNTYEATQDGFDKVNLVIQGAKSELGSYVSDLAEQYAPQIENFGKKAVNAIKAVIGWMTKNAKVVGGFAATLASVFAVTKIAKFVSSISKTISTFSGVAKAIGSVTKVTGLFNSALLSSPIGLVTGAVVGLGAAFVALRKKQEKELETQYGLNEEQEKVIEKAAEMRQSYEETDAARQESMKAIDGEFGYLTQLKEEYNKLIGKNGKVKKGYEDRAEFILNQLAEALGVERSEIDKTIKKNGELGTSIDELITKQKGEAILAANKEAYTEATQKSTEALNTLIEAQNVADEAEANYQKTLAETRKEREKIMTAAQHSAKGIQDYGHELSVLTKKEQIAKKAVEDAKKAVEDADTAYTGYMTNIKNYDELGAALISKDSKKIESAMMNVQNSFISAETGSEKSLKRQVENNKKAFENIKAAAEKGTAGVTAATVKNAEEMVRRSKEELKKWEEAHGGTFRNVLTEAGKTQEQIAKTGAGVGHAFWSNIESPENVQGSANAGAALRGAAKSEMAKGTQEASAEGGNMGGGFITGLLSKAKEAASAAWNFVTTMITSAKEANKSNSPSKAWRDEVGKMSGEGYIVGLASTVKDAAKEAKDFVDSAFTAAAGETKKDSSRFGLNSLVSGVKGSVATLSAGVAQSPSQVNSGGSGGTYNGGSVISYNQTINSPKPLSRIEIYRQTKNLLTLAEAGKGA